jgi:SAM-dependent methyltransferase
MEAVYVPLHIMSYHIPVIKYEYDTDNNLYITPKVDGSYGQFKFSDIDTNIYQCEILGNYAYVFDIICHDQKSFLHRMMMLEKIFDTKILFTVSNTVEIISILNDYSKKYTKINYDTNAILIRTKPVFIINKNIFNSDNIEQLFDIITNNYDTYYPNDGWIMYINSLKHPLKIKPLNHLTIDILYDEKINMAISNLPKIVNGKIIRCYWDNKYQSWTYLNTRNDKKKGNNVYVVNQIMNNVKYPIYFYKIWKSFNTKSNTFNFTEKHIQIRPYYKNTISKNIGNGQKNKIQLLRLSFFSDIHNLLLRENKTNISILDIGCGNGSLNKFLSCKKLEKFYYVGIDIDPFMLSHAYLNGMYYWNDINSDNFFDNIVDQQYDFAIFINSFHYIINKETFLKHLKQHVNKIIIINIFNNENTNIDTEEVKVVKLEKNMFEYHYKWKNDIFIEEMMRESDFTKNVNDSGWKILNIKRYDNNDEFIGLHTMYVLC